MPSIFSSHLRKMSSPCPPTFASSFKHSATAGTHGFGTVVAGSRRSPMRRVSLPSALPPQRSPNTLSPKLGFLKEISEFDIDPPFISPAASSSSSANTSPMLLSPSLQRPASARLYRRNPHHRHSQPNSPGSRKSRSILNRQFPPMADGRTPAAKEAEDEAEEEDDGFRWTDVDGFYGRKNSIPLQQLLANDLALLNGVILYRDGNDEMVKPNRVGMGNGTNGMDKANNNNNNNLINEEEKNEMNIPSDVSEYETEEEEKDITMEQMKRTNNTTKGMNSSKRMMISNGTQQQQQTKREKVNKRQSMPQQKLLLDSPTKRNLYRQTKIHSYEEGTKEHIDTEEEQNEEEEEEEETEEEEQSRKGHNLDNFTGGAKVKFANECNGMPFVDGTEESQKMLQKLAKTKEKRGKCKVQKQQQKARQLRHFNIDAHGHRIVDSGIRTLRWPSSSAILALQQAKRNSKNRRATCPEIWLSRAEEDSQLERVSCALRLYGLMNCGKKTVAKQLTSSLEVESANGEDDLASLDSEEWQKPYRTVEFLLNESEVHMEIIQGSLLPENRRFMPGGELTIFAVVYSVDNRESFIRAAQILFRLFGTREGMAQPKGGRGRKVNGDRMGKVPLILIANKIDLQRKRRVSPIEGKMLAKIYKCPFVEVSAMLSANMDTLWSEVLRKLQKSLQTREQMMLQQRRDSSDTAHTSPRNALVGRIMERTRRFAKSCEDWIAARIVAI